MKLLIFKAVAAIVLVAIGAPAWAQMTPEGLWRNVDDKTGEAKAEIRIDGLVGLGLTEADPTGQKDPRRDEVLHGRHHDR